jgi:uncharacterized protein (DUF2267 family)
MRGFDHTIQETNTWLNEIIEHMGNPDKQLAYHALAAGRPQKYHAEEFLARVEQELQVAGRANPERATRAVLSVLQAHIAQGEIEDIIEGLPKDIRRLWPDTQSA